MFTYNVNCVAPNLYLLVPSIKKFSQVLSALVLLYTQITGQQCYFDSADRNECLGENDCHDDATCTNEDGSYACTCNNGFRGTGFDCTGESYKMKAKTNTFNREVLQARLRVNKHTTCPGCIPLTNTDVDLLAFVLLCSAAIR